MQAREPVSAFQHIFFPQAVSSFLLACPLDPDARVRLQAFGFEEQHRQVILDARLVTYMPGFLKVIGS